MLEVSDRRTKLDFARFVKGLLDGRYKAFEPAEAGRLADRLEIHHTPGSTELAEVKHGSWLNMAEIELSVLGRRLADRVGGKEDLSTTRATVERERNDRRATIDWRFTTADARIKLKRLYPTIEVS